MGNVVDALENVLTRGLDAAKEVTLARLQVSANAPNASTPNGSPVAGGQPAGYGAALGGVPSWVWVAGVGLIALAVVPRLLKG